MHIFFSGIGGSGIAPLAMIAHQAGHVVNGSDKAYNNHIGLLRKFGINAYVGQTERAITALHKKHPIDWLVYASAIPLEHNSHPELKFTDKNKIKTSKRDELLNFLINGSGKKLIAVSGTHGKSTTTAMLIWLFKQLNTPISYSLGAEIDYGLMGEYDPDSDYFVYECDEFDRNFLMFSPHLSIISGIDWDHVDIYPTRKKYYAAFRQFIDQSKHVIIWSDDAKRIAIKPNANIDILDSISIIDDIKLVGRVNRSNASLAVRGLLRLGFADAESLKSLISDFPGVRRRFEKITTNIYSDYAHTPAKIQGALMLAKEFTNKNIVVVYEGLHNTRQHFIKSQLKHLFNPARFLYVVPSYLARENKSLIILTPDDLIKLTAKQKTAKASVLDDELKKDILNHSINGDLVLCFSAGGAGSLDEWLRANF